MYRILHIIQKLIISSKYKPILFPVRNTFQEDFTFNFFNKRDHSYIGM